MDKIKSILIIEDELPLQNAIKIKMKNNDFVVYTARDVEGAFKVLKNETISVIWLDHYLLGEENGLDFVTKLKNDEENKKIPIFVVSNTASPEKVRTYIKLGINNFFTKANNKLEDIIMEINQSI
ncbi:MAG: response regulator [Candidatus Kerfeldbacteria bacterium]|jgi:two-component system, OmpR family, phosphate regulon response regulator PhoB